MNDTGDEGVLRFFITVFSGILILQQLAILDHINHGINIVICLPYVDPSFLNRLRWLSSLEGTFVGCVPKSFIEFACRRNKEI